MAAHLAGAVAAATERPWNTETAAVMHRALVDVVASVVAIAAAFDIDLDAAYAEKTAICEERWG